MTSCTSSRPESQARYRGRASRSDTMSPAAARSWMLSNRGTIAMPRWSGPARPTSREQDGDLQHVADGAARRDHVGGHRGGPDPGDRPGRGLQDRQLRSVCSEWSRWRADNGRGVASSPRQELDLGRLVQVPVVGTHSGGGQELVRPPPRGRPSSGGGPGCRGGSRRPRSTPAVVAGGRRPARPRRARAVTDPPRSGRPGARRGRRMAGSAGMRRHDRGRSRAAPRPWRPGGRTCRGAPAGRARPDGMGCRPATRRPARPVRPTG